MRRELVEDDEEEGAGAISLERALGAVRRRLGLVAMLTALAAGMATAVALMLPERYEAAAVVQIDPRKKNLSSLDNVVSDLKADQATLESEVEVIRSRAILLKVIDKLDLRSDDEFNQPGLIRRMLEMLLGRRPATVPTRSADSPGAPIEDPMTRVLGSDRPGETVAQRDEIAALFADRIKVGRIRNTLLIEIRYSASDPAKAAKIANTIAEFYLADQLETKRKVAGYATEILERKIESMRARVATSERKVTDFKAAHGMFDSEGHLLAEKQLARVMEQAVLARNTTADAKAKFEQAQLMAKVGGSNDDIGSVLDSNTVRLLKDQLAGAMRKEAELRTRYGDRHPEILKITAEVKEARSQLDVEVQKIIANLRTEYEVAERREQQLQLALATLKDQETSSKGVTAELNELTREASTSKQLYEALLTRYKETSETETLQLPDARIVEQADIPLAPAAPKRLQIILIGLMGGLVGSLVLALALEFVTRGVSVPEDIEYALELPHLSSIPSAATPGGAALDPVRSVRLVLAEPESVFAESIRSMRREIDIRRRGASPRVILVTSSLAGEGSDVVASNLAHHYALTGARVVLVDGDLRRAPLTRRLTPGLPAGLADMLLQGLPATGAVLRDSNTGLHFLPAASLAAMAQARPELLTSSRMHAAIADLKAHYDTIVIEAPPLLPVVDGRILADFADQIVLVMTWRGTPKQLAKRALKSLGLNYAKVAGAVINGVDPAVIADGRAQQPGLVPARRAA